jgi:hypothetical protein
MRRLAALASLFLISGIGVSVAQPVPPPYAVVPPPRAEVVPPPRGERYVWEPGHWQWSGQRYVWEPGHYVERRMHRGQWVAGRWVWSPRMHQWVWRPAHWR